MAKRRRRRKPTLKQRILKEVREWIVSLALALLVVIVVRTVGFTLIRVDGSSMEPTLHDTERLFVTVYDAKFGTVERGDVVICDFPHREGDHFVKRVVGMPGDIVYRKSGVTHVVYTADLGGGPKAIDIPLDPEHAQHPLSHGPDYEPYTLAENEYFVVGDNRYHSHDSRTWKDGSGDYEVGPITRDMITGHVRQVVWPIDNFRPVE